VAPTGAVDSWLGRLFFRPSESAIRVSASTSLVVESTAVPPPADDDSPPAVGSAGLLCDGCSARAVVPEEVSAVSEGAAFGAAP